jgi:hypothetical protein
MALEVRPFDCNNGDKLILVKKGNCLTLNKLDKDGEMKRVASKGYYTEASGDKYIMRSGFDSDGYLYRHSYIPVGGPDARFTVTDGNVLLEGNFVKNSHSGINTSKIYSLDKLEIEGNPKNMGNLAKRYINKIIEHFAKLR